MEFVGKIPPAPHHYRPDNPRCNRFALESGAQWIGEIRHGCKPTTSGQRNRKSWSKPPAHVSYASTRRYRLEHSVVLRSVRITKPSAVKRWMGIWL